MAALVAASAALYWARARIGITVQGQLRFNVDVWSRQIRTAFPSLPVGKLRCDLAASAKRVADLCNRTWRREPVFRMDLVGEFGAVMELLVWACPVEAGWIRPQCRAPTLVRQKP